MIQLLFFVLFSLLTFNAYSNENLLTIQQQIERMRPEVERVNERNESKKLIELYELKRMHLLAKESQEIVNEKQKKVDEEQAKLAAEEAKFQPLKDQERELERRQKVDEKSFTTLVPHYTLMLLASFAGTPCAYSK